jgi:peptide/nickel transport system permease protein
MIAHPVPGSIDEADWIAEREEEIRWRSSESWIRRLLRRIGPNRSFYIGLAVLLIFVGVAISALITFGSNLGTLPGSNALARAQNPPGPSWAHPFGTVNRVGLDLYSAIYQATPIDLALVGGPILVALTIGLLLGATAALGSARIDGVVTAASDVVSGVPPFFLVMVLFVGVSLLIARTYWLLTFGLLFATILWPYYARPVRAEAQKVATTPYFEASRAAGANSPWLLRSHVIPNSLFPVLAQIPIDVYNIFFVLTVFPYLYCINNGLFGQLSPLPTAIYPEWGYLMAVGACNGWSPFIQANFWWMYTFPALTIILFGLGITLLCDGTERILRMQR